MPSSLSVLYDRAVSAFASLYGAPPQVVVAAPGRVNLIGEHTDYNDGFVMPVAIDRQVVIAASPRDDDRVELHSLDMGGQSAFSLGDIRPDPRQRWSNYQRGVALMLQKQGHRIGGMNAVITGDVPIGAGLSSSAAVEVATGYTFKTLYGLELDRVALALLAQRAENEFVGMRCGIMDQYISALGQANHALMIDCRSLEYKLVPVPPGVSIIVCDTRVQRGLVDSEYNARRLECETGARLLGVRALRDVTPAEFERRAAELPELTRRRCRHVVYEDQRVLDSIAALERGDLAAFGALMAASHASLRDDYQVSCKQLDIMVEAAAALPGVHGARMTGAGFGGCTVNLVESGQAAAFSAAVAAAYAQATGLTPQIYVCRAEDGVRALSSRPAP
ncbi:MAG: galactokinase [Chloroflexi bacterium]|nr:galactokinase [Chloroflexota bacterium]